MLTGIHLGAYGKDLDPGNSLDRVVKNILKADVPRLRLSSLEINEVSPLMLDLIAENNSLCPHLHLPLQSGSDKILRRMNRHYSGDEFLEKSLCYTGKNSRNCYKHRYNGWISFGDR